MKCSCDRRCHLSEVQHAGLRSNWRSASGSAASINCLSRHVFGILMNCYRPDPSRCDAKPRASQAPLSMSPSSGSSGKSAIFRLALATVRTKSYQDESLFRYLMGRVHYAPFRSVVLSLWCMVSRSDCPKLPHYCNHLALFSAKWIKQRCFRDEFCDFWRPVWSGADCWFANTAGRNNSISSTRTCLYLSFFIYRNIHSMLLIFYIQSCNKYFHQFVNNNSDSSTRNCYI